LRRSHAGEAPLPGFLQRHHADIDVALLEDAVASQKRFEVGDDLQERIAPRLDVVDQFWRQILMHATQPEIGRMHARTGGALIKYHQLFALFKAPQRRGQRADVHCLRGDVEQMRQDAADLAIEHADQLAAARHRDAEQFFRSQAEGVLLVHRRDVIEPVEIRDRLQIGLLLDQLFSATVKQPDMRIDALDDFAVELQHEAQHAMRGRMLRSEIDREIAKVLRLFVHGQAFGSAFSSPGSG
jgi:hypothetical protein